MDRILKAKHWQLFLLMMAIPLIFQVVFMSLMQQGQANSRGLFFLFFLVMLIPIATLFGWFWSVGVGLNDRVPADVNLNVKRFKIFWIIPLLYILIIGAVIMGVLIATSPGVFKNARGLMPLVLLLHLFSMFCIFYCMNFVAKTLRAIELKRKVTFGDYAGEFFMIWFFIIGIWILQPRINQIVNGKKIDNDEILDF